MAGSVLLRSCIYLGLHDETHMAEWEERDKHAVGNVFIQKVNGNAQMSRINE